MSSSLQDKVVLVTGGAKRIGAEIVRTLHGAGARVAIHYRSAAAEAQQSVATLNQARADSAIALRADLLDTGSLPQLIANVIAHFGQLDGLVNNASSFFATPLAAIGESEWQDLIGSNLKAPLFLTQAAAPWLKATRGAVVNITDVHAERPLKNYPLYCAAKAGLSGLTRALALELAPEVRVNAVAPGAIQWPEGDEFSAAARAAIIEHSLLKRCGEATDIARAVLFLLADAPYVTGQTIVVDGGRQIRL